MPSCDSTDPVTTKFDIVVSKVGVCKVADVYGEMAGESSNKVAIHS